VEPEEVDNEDEDVTMAELSAGLTACWTEARFVIELDGTAEEPKTLLVIVV